MNAPPVKIAVIGMAVLALVLVTLGLAHVARRQQIIRHGYELSRALEELAREQEENRRLRLEISTLTNPDRIRRLAAQLGMSQPGPDQIRVIRTRDEVARAAP
jgi:cell division protein FtsL